jgi:vacuolar-type H+-ATPase subunit E/Vma4
MGCKELIEALHRTGDEKLRALRQEAEAEAERIRADSASRIGQLRLDEERRTASEAAEHAARVLADARAESKRVRLQSEHELAERLHGLAKALLPSLRNEGYSGVFASFVHELPALNWAEVRVNPKDISLARESFPGAEIVSDSGISGGFVALSEGGDVQVVNTLEQRLETLWPEMLTEIMREAEEKVG